MTVLNHSEIEERIRDLDGWQFSGNSLQKEFTFNDFRSAMAIMVRISYEAEAMDHHPEWTNVYNRLAISLSTHSAGGVTDKDIELAKRIEQITS